MRNIINTAFSLLPAKPSHVFCFALVILLSFSACDSKHKNHSNLKEGHTHTKKPLPALRVLIWSGHETYLPRNGSPLTLEIDYLKRYAKAHQLELKEIPVARFSDLIPKLLAGEGDLIASNLSITPKRKTQVNFTVPFEETSEFFVQAAHEKPINYASQLKGLTIGVSKGTAFELTAQWLKRTYPSIKIKYIPSTMNSEAIYDQLVAGDYNLIIEDKNLLRSTLQYRDDIQESIQASGKRKIAWAVKFDNSALLKSLNTFLRHEKLTIHTVNSYKNRWHRIQQEKTIRFVMRNSFSSYYFWRGELLGFNYDLAKKFCEENNLRLEIVVAKEYSDMINFIKEDKADIALGYLTPTQERIDQGIAFSIPYHYASEMLVTRADDTINDISLLKNREAVVRRSSSYSSTLNKLKAQIPKLAISYADESSSTASIIDDVANSLADVTVADSHIFNLEMFFRQDIKAPFALGEPKGQSWAIKQNEPELMKPINRFIKKYYKGLFYNVKYNQYFKNEHRLGRQHQHYDRVHKDGTLSPYDSLIKTYATQYNFDWRLMVAQMHQESGFSVNAKSFAGATGLFQLMPRTAKQLGVTNINDPENNIRAGIMYMDWVRERMSYIEPEENQLIWFTLAAYNAGAGHVRDAVYLAKKKGWDEKMWFGNVEKAMLLLSQKKYYHKARHGYVRGSEPVTYVREIKRRFDTFKLAVDSVK